MIRVQEIHRFPVKGLGPERLDSAEVAAGGGIEGDRAVALSNGTRPASDGWDGPGAFTALKNEISGAAYATRTAASGAITVTAPDGTGVTFDPADAADRERAAGQFRRWFPPQGGHPRRLVRADAGMFDSRLSGLSIINLETVRALSAAAGRHVDPLRFRGNLYVDGLPPFAEFGLVGQRVRLGEVTGLVSKPIERCSATSVNPLTAASDLPIPQLLARDFGHLHCGVYLQVENAGRVSAGDTLKVLGVGTADRPPSPAPRVMGVVGVEAHGEIAEITLEDPTGATARLYRPGHHLRVHFTTPSGPLWRTYTITDVADTRVSLAVRRRGQGSRLLASLAPGDTLLASGPLGQTSLEARSRLALVSAGIGITPTLGILAGLLRSRERPEEVRVVHVERTGSPLATRARDLASRLRAEGVAVTFTHVPTSLHGRPGRQSLEATLAGTRDVFVCGPRPFMDAVAAAAPGASVHREVFASPAPRGTLEAPELPPSTLTYGEASFPWRPSDGTLLDALEARGFAVDSSCRGGACGTCHLALRAGTVEYTAPPLAEPPAGQVLACSAYPDGDVTLVPPSRQDDR